MQIEPPIALLQYAPTPKRDDDTLPSLVKAYVQAIQSIKTLNKQIKLLRRYYNIQE